MQELQIFSKRMTSENHDRKVFEIANQEKLQAQMHQLTLLVDGLSEQFQGLTVTMAAGEYQAKGLLRENESYQKEINRLKKQNKVIIDNHNLLNQEKKTKSTKHLPSLNKALNAKLAGESTNNISTQHVVKNNSDHKGSQGGFFSEPTSDRDPESPRDKTKKVGVVYQSINQSLSTVLYHGMQ